jgi:hypothetical protein
LNKLKTKISIYLILVMIFTILMPYLHEIKAEEVRFDLIYQIQQDTVNIDKYGNAWFIAKAKRATTGIRFRTIGFTARFEKKGGTPLGITTRFKMEEVPPKPGEEPPAGYYTYTKYSIPVTNPDGTAQTSIIDRFIVDNPTKADEIRQAFVNGGTMYLDAVFTIVENGKRLGSMDMDGNLTGETYTTLKGIQNARGWARPDLFKDYFNKPIPITEGQLTVEVPVYATYWLTTGQRLDPQGHPDLIETVYMKKGENKTVTVNALRFPGYKLVSSAFNYTGKGGVDDEQIVTGDGAATRNIPVKAEAKNYVYFYYQAITCPGDPSCPQLVDGDIIFTPNTSFDISGNRDGWVNEDIRVKIEVESSKKEVTMTDSESRGYKYKVKHRSCHRNSKGKRRCHTYYTTEHGSTSCRFEQKWTVNTLEVWGEGYTLSGSQVNIPRQIISDGGTITISQELKDITLHAKVDSWTKGSKRFICGGPPN